MKDIENSRNSNIKKGNSNFSYDNDDIIKQLSQITSNDDKSFESSLTSKNIPILYDKNNFSKDINSVFSERNKYQNEIKNMKKNPDYLLINKKYFPLNQKLKYLCSLIQTFNINIKKYDDLKEFDTYFSKDILKPNQLEPINILFDIISELIFYIQRELKNNSILMNEIKLIKQKRTEQETLINKLKYQIKNKEIELEKMESINKEDYSQFNLKEKEINDLKNENNELSEKINSYKNQIKDLKNTNKKLANQLESSNTNNNFFNFTLSKDLNNPNNTLNLYSLNNSYSHEHSKICLKKRNKTEEKNNLNLYFGKTTGINKKYINNEENLSLSKKIRKERITDNNSCNRKINYTENNNNNNKNIKNGSIIINLKALLKEINDMLNEYNSNLEKVNLNNNINRNNNIKSIYDFVNVMNNKLDKLKNISEINNENNNINGDDNKKSIQVNTSRWKFRKKTSNKKSNLNIRRKNTSTSLKKNLIFNKLLE